MQNKQSVLYLTPKATYYNTEAEVIKQGEQIHTDLFNEDRELYTYLMYFVNSTYFSKSLIMKNLLTNSLHKPEFSHELQENSKLLDIENVLIHHALFNENITHAIKMLLQLKSSRINNSRTSKVILDFLFNRGNTDYIVIKYKKKVKDLLIHALGLKTVNEILKNTAEGIKKYNKLIRVYNNPYDLQVFHFVFDKNYEYTSEYLKEYIRVRDLFKNKTINVNEKTTLPVEVLIGFNNFFKTNIGINSLISSGNVSEKQKIQLQNTVKRHSNNVMEIKVDLNKYSIIELLKYAYNKADITIDEVAEIQSIIRNKSVELKSKLNSDNFLFNLDKTAVIVDCSDSHLGSQQTKNHPLFKNLALANIFTTDDSNIIYVGGEQNDKNLIQPLGDTNLSKGLLEAVKRGFENVIVLSDGFENVGSFDKVFKQLKTIGYNVNAIHFNPVFSPKNFTFKEISDEVFTLPFTNEQDVENLFMFYYLNTDKNKFKMLMRDKIEQLMQKE